MKLVEIAGELLAIAAGSLTRRSVRIHMEPIKGVHVNLFPIRGLKKAAKRRKHNG